MNTIHYFATENRWVAVAPGQFSETVTFCHSERQRYPLFASISFQTGSFIDPEWYERVENGDRISNYEEYTEARCNALLATLEFFGEYEPFQTPPAEVDTNLMQGFLAQVNKSERPEYVERAGRMIKNDLPF